MQSESIATPERVALEFVERVNQHNAVRVGDLMTDDHVFVDALGNRLAGREKMASAWQSFFSHFPNYKITIDSTLSEENTVALFGSAGGGWRVQSRDSLEAWSVPAAWRAVVANGAISEWRVWCDTAWASGPPSQTATEERRPGAEAPRMGVS
jgi:ketosteroid isomerase-like protein